MSLLTIKNLSKECENLSLLKDINLNLDKGKCIGIKCSNELGDIFFDLLLGKVSFSKGNIYMEDTEINEYKNIKNNISCVFNNEGFYERSKVIEYMNFFKKIYNYKKSINEILAKLGLLDISNNKIEALNYSQKKRLSIARSLLSNSKIILMEEPTLNVDRESALIIRECIPYICSLGISIIAISVSLEDIILLGGETYTLNEKGLIPFETDISNEADSNTEIDTPYFKKFMNFIRSTWV